jgi:UDP-N-acetylmuramoyl-tripeptide--D-alanyl-D-alanine ligase
MKFISDSNDLSNYLNQSAPKNIDIKDISTDTRTIRKGSLFIGIKGNNFNGNDFIEDAIHKGAYLVITDSRKYINHKNENIVYVDNSVSALRKIASNILKSFDGNIVGITGSNGKTTTTKIISKILPRSSGTIKNFNNEIGMPLSIINANKNSKNLIIEMGASKIGDIEYLSSILKPNIGIITNIGNSHLENLKNLEGVLKVKSELIDNISKHGYLIVPGQNKEHLDYWREIRNDVNIITFGSNPNNDFYFSNEKHDSYGMEFSINSSSNNVNIEVKTDLKGKHNIDNILVAYIVNYLSNEDDDSFKKKILKIDKFTSRQIQLDWINKSVLIDDTYNANPDSVKKSIDLLCENSKRKLLILGDMLELGPKSKKFHQEVGRYALEKGVDLILGFGKDSKYSVEIFRDNGFFFESEEDLKNFIKNNVKSNDIVLIKGSRGMKMEKFINV